MVASSSVTWRSRASKVASKAASRAGLPAVAAGCGGRLSRARARIRAATVTFSRQPCWANSAFSLAVS
jgi:hypothetical protein